MITEGQFSQFSIKTYVVGFSIKTYVVGFSIKTYVVGTHKNRGDSNEYPQHMFL